MDLDLFLPTGGDWTAATWERLADRYPGLFHLRVRETADPLFHQYWLASLPLDDTTGHWLAGDPSPRSAARAYSGYGAGYGSPYRPAFGAEPDPVLPAIALWNRMALVPLDAGPPTRLRPGLFAAPFHIPSLLRSGFHQALEDALSEVRAAHDALLARHAYRLPDPDAARLLGLTEAALRRALWE